MSIYTRRTHIVRVPLDTTPTAPGKKPGKYMDVEVLDAISFRMENGKEVILNSPAASAVPFIIDDTGGGNGATPTNPTRRSHMKQLTGSDDASQTLYVEIMDCMAFRDQNGEEWILDMQATTGSGPAIFDETDGSGDNTATRRVHDEVITSPFGKGNSNPPPTTYVTVQRVDAIAFRKVSGDEVVFVCPSNDDPTSSDPRAKTFTFSPSAPYDPSDTSASAVVPPTNSDPHVYLAMPSGSRGFNLKETKISQGPFWWIRNVSSGEAYLVITVDGRAATDGAPPPGAIATIIISPDDPFTVIEAEKPVTTQNEQTFPPLVATTYFIWTDSAPFPTLEPNGTQGAFGTVVFSTTGAPVVNYGTQFSQVIDVGAGAHDVTGLPGTSPDLGTYASLVDAQAGAAALNAQLGGPEAGSEIIPFGTGSSDLVPLSPFFGTSITQSFPVPSIGTSSMTQRFLIGPFPDGVSNFTVNISGANQSSDTTGDLYLDIPGTPKTIEDITNTDAVIAATGVDGNTGNSNITYSVAVTVGKAADGSDSSVVVTGGGGGGVG
jgi:hypothetical protein